MLVRNVRVVGTVGQVWCRNKVEFFVVHHRKFVVDVV